MRKERLMAIVIGLIMIGSILGYGAMSVFTPGGETNTITLPSVVKEELTKDMKIYALQRGKVIVEHFYASGCDQCLEMNAMLEMFASQFSKYMVIEEVEVPENETKFQAIGSAGRITELEYNMTQDSFMETFCDIAISMPKECLLGEMV